MTSPDATDKPPRKLTREEQSDYGGRYASGTISLEHALRGLLWSGQPIPPAIAEAVERAFLQYEVFEIDNLAEAFGFLETGRQRKESRKQLHSQVRRHRVQEVVLAHHERGHPLTDPTYHENTAFELAAVDLGMSPSLVFAIYRGRR